MGDEARHDADSADRPNRSRPGDVSREMTVLAPAADAAPSDRAPVAPRDFDALFELHYERLVRTSSTDAPNQPEPFTRPYDSAGGSIVVSWDGSALSLGSVTPAAGFEPEVEDNRADRVRVRFRGDDDDHRIEVRINDGELEVRIE